MGLYFLYFLFFILAPLGYGVALAVLLKELHARQQEKTTKENDEIVTEPKSEKPEVSPEPDPEPEEPESPPEEPEPAAEEPEPPAAETPEPEPPAENRPQSVFDDEGLLPKNFKADEILDSMFDEDRPETPEDLASRMEEPTDAETIPDGYDDDSDDDPLGLEDDFLARVAENAGLDDTDEKSKIDFEEEFSDEEKEEEPISSMAREILGDDFDFDSLMSKDQTNENRSEDDVFQTETKPLTPGPPSPELLSDEHEIISIFPDEMVSETTVGPDLSEAARSHCFVEELRPMFVRRRR